MKEVTGLDFDCYTQEESIAIIDKVYVQNKISTQFFSPVTYNEQGIMNSEFKILFHQIGKDKADRNAYTLKRTKVSFQDNWLYSNPILTYNEDNLVYYDAEYSYG